MAPSRTPIRFRPTARASLRGAPRACALAGALAGLAGLAPPALAATPAPPAPPATPAGWVLRQVGELQVWHRDAGGLGAELRLYPVEPAQALDAWFATRMASDVPGVPGARFESPTASNRTSRFALGTGQGPQGQPLRLVRLGCDRPHGGLLFGDAVVSDDGDFVREGLREATTLFTQACFAGATQAEAAAVSRDIAPSPPARSPAPSPAPKPYAFVTAPNAGLKSSDVQAIVRRWANVQSGMTMQVMTFYALLMKDGSAHDGLPPVALADFDAARSRREAPREWGSWTRDAQGWRVTFAGQAPATFPADSVRRPARPGEALQGRWEGHSAYSSLWSVSRSQWTVDFSADGRFVKDARSSIVGGAGSTGAGNFVGGTVSSSSRGTTGTMVGGNFAATSTRAPTAEEADRSGRYRLDGYTLELTYDNGRVERQTFCASTDADKLWFEGWELGRVRPEASH